MIFGLISGIPLIFYNYKKIGEISMALYLGLIFMLFVTLIFGKRVNGAKSWLPFFGFGLQVSELGKLIIIIFTAKYISIYENDPKYRKSFFFVILTGVFVFIPVALILVQPDFGTILIYFSIFITMAIFGDLNLKILLSVVIIVFAGFLIPLIRAYYSSLNIFTPLTNIIFSNTYILIISGLTLLLGGVFLYLYFSFKSEIFLIFSFIFFSLAVAFIFGILLDVVLKDYQKKRLIVFINPDLDRLGAGYNIIQSKIAVGSGGLTGKGILNGTQSQFGFLPERSTDFIFSIIGEELGYLGTFSVVAIFTALLMRLLYLATKIKDFFGKLIIIGIFAYFFTQSMLNIGMTMGLMPITGVPLPFVSYGGSSLLNSIYSILLVQNIELRRYSLE